MCGIAGLRLFSNNVPFTLESASLSLINSLLHRGPDCQQYWLHPSKSLSLVHTRLSIQDISSVSNQPFGPIRGVSNNVLVFNGEIYNFKALRLRLQGFGYTFFTDGDTEVLYFALLHWGPKCLQFLEGMYSFAFWDDSSKNLYLARDPYGIKPLYYYHDSNFFAFASEVHSIYNLNTSQFSTNDAAFLGLLLNGYIPEPLTTYNGIYKVNPGTLLTLSSDGCLKSDKCISVPRMMSSTNEKLSDSLSSETSFAYLQRSLRSTVQRHILSDVPYCIFLSSGIDSSLLLALASEEDLKPVPSLTLSFDSNSSYAVDESNEASQLAIYYNSPHRKCHVSDRDGSALITKYFASQDQPCIDGFNTWLISSFASEMGIKVALSGLGADELFSGYNYYKLIPKIYRFFKVFNSVPSCNFFSRKLSPLLSLFHPKLPSLLTASNSIPSLYSLFRSVFSLIELSELVPYDFIESGLQALPRVDIHIDDSFDNNNLHPWYLNAIDSTNYLLGQLLSVSDTASMSHSIELRTPFVDLRLLSEIQPFMLSKFRNKLSSKKNLSCIPNQVLPEYIYNKNKLGFSLPMAKWLSMSNLTNNSLSPSRYSWSQSLSFQLFRQYYD